MKLQLSAIQVFFFLLLMLPGEVMAQTSQQNVWSSLEGHWEGSFIRNNASQPLKMHFYKKGNDYYSLQVIEEWHPQFGEFELAVSIDSLGIISTNTGHGKAFLTLDPNNLELTGYLDKKVPAMYVHLKKVAPPPQPNYSIETVSVRHKGVNLSGHLHLPDRLSGTAIILVGGRGCYAGSTKYDLYAKILRKYGVAVIAFNKRGTGESTGDCNTATIGDLAEDVIAWKKYLETRPENFQNIGVLGSSAGGWVMVKAQEKANFDFMISIVGPATSVKEQQFQSLEYGAAFYQLSPEAKAQIIEYTNLVFSAKANPKTFGRMQELLLQAEQQDWKKLLDDTDIPASTDAIDSLWVRRHNYDPEKVLSKFKNPFLAIYGGIDWIVPYKENIEELKQFFPGDRASLLTTVVAHNAEHGTEVAGNYIKLRNNGSYWHFFRISPQVTIEIIKFLEEHQFILRD